MPIVRRKVVVFTGERRHPRGEDVRAAFKAHGIGPGWIVAHGAARGVDTTVDRVAREVGILWKDIHDYPADWATHGWLAGPLRNSEMLDKEQPELVIAFPGPRCRGTRDMMRKAQERGIDLVVYWRGQSEAPEEFEG